MAREQAEAVQAGSLRLVAVSQGERDRLLAQRRYNDAFAAVARRVVDQLPFVDLLRSKHRPFPALDADIRGVLTADLDLAPLGPGGRVGGEKIVPDLGWPTDLDTDKIAGLGGRVLL